MHDKDWNISFTGMVPGPDYDGMTAMQVEEEIDQAQAATQPKQHLVCTKIGGAATQLIESVSDRGGLRFLTR